MELLALKVCVAALQLSISLLNANAPAISKPETYKSINASITAYSGVESCHYENCTMASGKRAYIGAVACPRKYELGTEIEIAGERYVCEDRTALWIEKKYGEGFDIFFGYDKEAQKRALEWGRKNLQIKIYTQVTQF